MTVNVYWSYNIFNNLEGYRVEDPVEISKKFLNNSNAEPHAYSVCPSTTSFLKNLYGLKHIYDVKLDFDIPNNAIRIEESKQELKLKINVRSFSDKLFSFPLEYIFFTEEKSLELEVLPAYLEDNDVVNKTIMIPGKIDIGKWLRPLDFSFHIKNDNVSDSLYFNRKDIISYVHFKTNDKIKLNFFHFTHELKFYVDLLLSTRNNKNKYHGLEWFYNIFNKRGFKKKIIKQIKENLI